MKKISIISILLVMSFAFMTAADDITMVGISDNEISFRDIPWGATPDEAISSLKDFLGKKIDEVYTKAVH